MTASRGPDPETGFHATDGVRCNCCVSSVTQTDKSPAGSAAFAVASRGRAAAPANAAVPFADSFRKSRREDSFAISAPKQESGYCPMNSNKRPAGSGELFSGDSARIGRVGQHEFSWTQLK